MSFLSAFNGPLLACLLCCYQFIFTTVLVQSATTPPAPSTTSSYVVDVWGPVDLPFALNECHHGLPDTSKYIEYTCTTAGQAQKNTTTRDLCGDQSAVDTTFTASDFRCAGDTGETDVILMETFCSDFNPPMQRDIMIVPNVCVLLSTINSVTIYVKLYCAGTSHVTTYFYTSLTDCETNYANYAYSRDLTILTCGIWLFPNETGVTFDIKAEVCMT